MSDHPHTQRNPEDEDPYETDMARRGAPKSRFPARRCDPRLAYALVHDELLLDGVARMNLATFCTTWAEPEALRLLAESFDKNIVDKDEYPQTAELEARCVRMLADLWSSPHPDTTLGTSTTGSSEAAMLSGLAAKFRWRARRRAAGVDERGAAELRVRPGAGLLGEVRALLRRRDPRGADGRRALPDGAGAVPGALRREHDHGRRDARADVHGPVRGRRGDRGGARSASKRKEVRTSRCTSTARAAGSWRRSRRRSSCGTSVCRA